MSGPCLKNMNNNNNELMELHKQFLAQVEDGSTRMDEEQNKVAQDVMN
jgi:hypothetical protein